MPNNQQRGPTGPPILGNKLIRWSSTGTPTQAGDIGMDVSSGIPYAYIGGASTPLVYSGGNGIIDPAIDANSQLRYACDEASGSLVNTGNAASGDLTATGSPTYQAVGNRRYAVYIPGSGRDGFSGAASVEPSSFSIFALIFAFQYANPTTIFEKDYAIANTWSTPFVSVQFGMNNSSTGGWAVGVAVSGALQTLSISNARIPYGMWTFVGATFDGSSHILTAYMNGVAVGTLNAGGAVDYGTHGNWNLGTHTKSAVPSNGQPHFGFIRQVGLDNTVRNAAWWSSTWRGMIASPTI